jgi:hypothetical protein
MSDSAFWQKLAEKFRALPKEYVAAIRAEKEAILGQIETTPWILGGKVGPKAEFGALAVRGAKRFSRTPTPNLLDSWLEAIHRNVPDASDRNFTGAHIDNAKNERVSTASFTMYNLPKRSATYCSMMESAAVQAEFDSAVAPHFTLETKPITTETLEVPYPTIEEQIQTLRDECKWTIEILASKTGFDEKTVKRHLSGRAMPHLRNLSVYQRVFSKALKREVVIKKTPPKRPPNAP